MKLLPILTLLIAPLVIANGESVAAKWESRFPKREHVTTLQLYEQGYPANAIDKVIGKSVLLDVVVTIEREVPLVEIVIPKALATSPQPPHHAISAHLINTGTQASSLKKDERLRIEGIIVNEGYGAYTIYLHQARHIK